MLDFDAVSMIETRSRLGTARDAAEAASSRLSYFFLANASATDSEEGETINAVERNWTANENFMLLSRSVYDVVAVRR